jgi:hypothetical protein
MQASSRAGEQAAVPRPPARWLSRLAARGPRAGGEKWSGGGGVPRPRVNAAADESHYFEGQSAGGGVAGMARAVLTRANANVPIPMRTSARERVTHHSDHAEMPAPDSGHSSCETPFPCSRLMRPIYARYPAGLSLRVSARILAS